MNKTRILIADDHNILRMGLKALIGTTREFTVVGQAENGIAAVEETLRLKPDVVIMDLMMPKKDGIAATVEIKRQSPGTKILLLTTYATSDGIARALEAGAEGALLKTASDTELLDALARLVRGEQVLASDVEQLLADDPPVRKLTPREQEVLEALAQGYSNAEIATRLSLRRDGVNLHVMSILQKLNAANRTEAVAIALRKHLLKL